MRRIVDPDRAQQDRSPERNRRDENGGAPRAGRAAKDPERRRTRRARRRGRSSLPFARRARARDRCRGERALRPPGRPHAHGSAATSPLRSRRPSERCRRARRARRSGSNPDVRSPRSPGRRSRPGSERRCDSIPAAAARRRSSSRPVRSRVAGWACRRGRRATTRRGHSRVTQEPCSRETVEPAPGTSRPTAPRPAYSCGVEGRDDDNGDRTVRGRRNRGRAGHHCQSESDDEDGAATDSAAASADPVREHAPMVLTASLGPSRDRESWCRPQVPCELTRAPTDAALGSPECPRTERGRTTLTA